MKHQNGRPRGSATEHAYKTLRQQILTGSLRGGQRLREAPLAANLGLSRTPVRDALGRLAGQGLVERGPGSGMRVATFPADEVEQIFAIREMLETYAAERAARFASTEDIARLRALADEMSACAPPECEPHYARLAARNEAFHKMIVQVSGSARLNRLLTMTIDMALVLRTYNRYTQRELERSCKHHHEIVDALEARAPEWAASVMRSHLLAAAAVARRNRNPS